jgi:multidrug efflux pump subunit AcrB
MWIVRLALRRPYTFVVAALLLLLLTPFVITKTPTDIFPAINIPVVSVIWSYTGLPADQIAQRLVYSEERALTTTVDNIEHIESTSYDSFGVIKVFFQQGTNPSTAVAQLTAVSQTILKQLPPGTTPPLIISTARPRFLFFNSESAAPNFRSRRFSTSLLTRFASG